MTNCDLFTIGHSDHSQEQFLDLLRQHEIEALVHICRFPSSRSLPHFNRDELSSALSENDMDYEWLQSLDGRQPRRKDFDSPNMGQGSVGEVLAAIIERPQIFVVLVGGGAVPGQLPSVTL